MTILQNITQILLAKIFGILKKISWEGIIIVAFLISLFETLMVFLAHNVKSRDMVVYFVFNFDNKGDTGFIQITELLIIFINAFLLWFIIFFLLNILFLLREKINNKILKLSLKGIIWAVSIPLLLLYVINWTYFWHNKGQFLNRDLINFGLSNFGHLMWHLLKFSSSLFVVVFSLTCIISLFFRWSFRKVFLSEYQNRSPKVIVCFIVIIITGSILLNIIHQKTGQRPQASLIAMFSLPKRKYDHIDVVKKYSLVPKTRHVDYSTVKAENPVIIAYIESMRYDLVSLKPSPIPNIVSFIPHNVFFEKTYAVSSHSNYADASFWFCQFPLRSQGIYVYRKDTHDKGMSVFDVFKRIGYQTAYITSQNETWGGMINWMKHPGIDYFYHAPDYEGKAYIDENDHGFARFAKQFKLPGKIPDSETLAIARKWIKSTSSHEKFFLGINLQNTHYSYHIPEDGETPFEPMDDFTGMFGSWPKSEFLNVRNRYMNAFYNVDKLIGEFITFLKKEHIWENCIFMIVGDNGEAFYEHGYANHAGYMHEEVIRTFALLKTPSPAEPVTISYPVSHIDLISGILDLLKIPQPYSFQGSSPFKRKRENIFFHANSIKQQDGIIHWPWKLLSDNTRKYIELYNLEVDPLERENMILKQKNIAEDLLKQLAQWKSAQLEYYSKPEIYSLFYPPQFK